MAIQPRKRVGRKILNQSSVARMGTTEPVIMGKLKPSPLPLSIMNTTRVTYLLLISNHIMHTASSSAPTPLKSGTSSTPKTSIPPARATTLATPWLSGFISLLMARLRLSKRRGWGRWSRGPRVRRGEVRWRIRNRRRIEWGVWDR